MKWPIDAISRTLLFYFFLLKLLAFYYNVLRDVCGTESYRMGVLVDMRGLADAYYFWPRDISRAFGDPFARAKGWYFEVLRSEQLCLALPMRCGGLNPHYSGFMHLEPFQLPGRRWLEQ